ncbi:MAG: hydrogenase 3 maturation endopeptidase HyCI [Thermoplasmatota archaeon]
MKYLIVCIGNRDGGDDAVGPFIADQLKTKNLDDVDVLDVGIAPENFTDVIKRKKPDILLLVDAVDMGLKPGEIRQVSKGHLGVMHISTHGIPLSLLMTYFERYIDTVLLFGIQPKQMKGSMTREVEYAADQLVRILSSKDVNSVSKL